MAEPLGEPPEAFRLAGPDASGTAAFARSEPAEPYGAVLNRLNHAVVMVAADGSIAFQNLLAAAITAERDGVLIDGRAIRLWKLEQTVWLRRRLAAISSPDGTAPGVQFLRVDRPSERLSLLLAVEPLAATHGFHVPPGTAIISIVDPERPQPQCEDLLRAMFSLTPAEASVAEAVSRGIGVKAVAKLLGIEPTTVRTLLQRVFAKTQTCRQAELARLIGHARSLARSGASHGEPEANKTATEKAGMLRFPDRDAPLGPQILSCKWMT